MKIVLISDPEITIPPVLYGGIERIVNILVHELVALKHDVTLFAHPESKVPCKLVGWKRLNTSSYADVVRNTGTLLKWAFKEKYDVIHSFGRLAYLTPLLPLKVPKIMSYQREPSLHQIGKAVMLSRRNSLLFTGCSNYITNQIKTVARAVTVYNCVPIGQYIPVETVPINAPLIFLGRIEPIKGTHLAVEVAQETGRNLIIAGNIPEEGKIYFEEQIRPHLNTSITYVSPVNDIQKNRLLGQACCLLMPIQWNEPFGIVMIEAMACGTPVIGFPYGAVPEVIQDGFNGFICKDVKEMILKVEQLEQIDRKKVRFNAEERFSDKVIVRKYLSAYNTF